MDLVLDLVLQQTLKLLVVQPFITHHLRKQDCLSLLMMGKRRKRRKKKKKTPGEPSDSDTELRGKSLSAELPAGSELPARCSVCVCVCLCGEH